MGTLADKLRLLKATKENIKGALIAKGVEVSDSDTFASYAGKIEELSSGTGVSLMDIEIYVADYSDADSVVMEAGSVDVYKRTIVT